MHHARQKSTSFRGEGSRTKCNLPKLFQRGWHGALPTLALAAYSPLAHSHVKWFAQGADLSAAPLPPGSVLTTPLFPILLMLTFGVVLGLLAARAGVNRKPGVLAKPENIHTMAALLRPGMGLYLCASALYFHDHPITLAPELTIASSWLPPLQILLGILAMCRWASLPAAAGILGLYAYSVHVFGMFHMLDYLFIPGIAIFMVLDTPCYNNLLRGITVLRLTTGFSLLWAGVEKWMQPEWSIDVLTSTFPDLLGVFPKELVVMSAGFVEYALAFLLIFGRKVSQYAAFTLLTLLLAAIPLAGWVDAIGHLPLIVILLLLLDAPNETFDYDLAVASLKDSWVRALLFLASVPIVICSYWLADTLAFDRAWNADALLSALTLLMTIGIMHQILFKERGIARSSFLNSLKNRSQKNRI